MDANMFLCTRVRSVVGFVARATNRLAVYFALVLLPPIILSVQLFLAPSSALFSQLSYASLALGSIGVLGLFFRYRQIQHEMLAALKDCANQQEQLRSILETAADAILTWDESGRIHSINPAGSKLFGYTANEALDLLVKNLLRDPNARNELAAVKTNEQRMLGVQRNFVGVRKDGSTFSIAVALSKFRRNEEGLFVAIVHDLTALESARKAAEAADRAKTVFLTSMSHELLTPLHGLLGMVCVLRGNPSLAEASRCLDSISHSADRLLALVRQVADYSQLSTENVKLAHKPFSLLESLGPLIAEFKPLAQSRGLTFCQELPQNPSVICDGDRERLQEVLRHLLQNAIQFTKRGSVTLRVRCSQTNVQFEIRDTGSGIEPERLHRIFTPFEQGGAGSSRRDGSIGLGLSIASRLVELMGGQLLVTSEPGAGSCFSFRLPLRQTQKPISSPDSTRRQPPNKSTRVLLLLQGQESRQEFARQIESCGYQVGLAQDLRGAQEVYLEACVQGEPFSVILVDASLLQEDPALWMARLDRSTLAPCPFVLLQSDSAPNLWANSSRVSKVASRLMLPAQLRDLLDSCHSSSDRNGVL
jgi:PAS domain S-box-containing protein